MRFVDSKRFSPVVHMGDLPAEEDLFHFRSSDIDKSKDGRAEFIEKNNIIIDKEWWQKQYIRCTQGYYVENAIERGGDAIVDGVDAIWDGDDCYLPQYDLLIRNKTIFIPPRYYFYLNFWLIYGVPEGEHVKQLMKPLFTDMDFLYARRIEMMYLFDKDNQELKSRQKGVSEKSAGMLCGFNYTFLPASINVIVGGTQGDADHTMSNTIRGLDELANTQFYLARKKGGDRADYIESAKTKSKVLSLTAKDNAQTVSRYCLAKGTKVITYSGELKNVEDIKINDELMGIDSSKRIVQNVHNGVDQMYKISSSISKDFICNSQHLLYCHHKPVTRKKDMQKGAFITNLFRDKDINKIDDEHFTITAENYFTKSKTFKRHCTLVKSDTINFSPKKIEVDPYFLGIWLGDGDSDCLRISSMDPEIEDYLSVFAENNDLFIKKNPMINPLTGEKSKASRYAVSFMDKDMKQSKSLLRKNFTKYNLFKNKHIPDCYLYNTIEVRMQLLAGLIDTDGWKSKNGYGFAQVKESLLRQVVWLCESLGFQVNVNFKENGSVNGYVGNPIYELYIYGYNIHKIPVKIKRKKQSEYTYRSRFPNRSRFSIEKLDVQEYYGFEIDKDKLFLLEDFTILHNSPTLVIMEEIGKGKKEWSLETAEFIKPSIYAQNGIKTGWIYMIGTGGEMSDGVYDLEQRCYNPKDYNLLTFKNMWTELTTNYGEEVSHFTPAWWMKIMDKNGNTLKAESLEAIEKEYKNTAADKKYRFKTQSPIFIENVFLSSDAGYFGKDAIMLLNNRYASIVGNKAFQIEKQYVLEFKNPKNPFAGVTFKPKENGWLNIIEEPFKDLEGETYLNLYTSGCLIPGEKVLTNNGFKNVELVNERDKLINENGKSVSITKFYIHKKINSSVYNIKVSNTLRSNIVTEEHPVLITKPKFYPDKTIKEIDFDFNYIEASKIEVGDWTRIPNMYTDTNYDISNFWDNSNSRIDRHIKNPLLEKDFWWFVGLWIGDGYCVNNKITISINSKEQCYINKLEQIVVNLFDRKLEIRKRNPSCYECSFSFAQLTEFLFLHFGKYSHSKFISEWVKYINPIYKKNLLHGYLDSDGCIYRHTKGYYQLCYVSINLELLESFQDIAFSLGHISNLCQLREKGKVNFRGKDFDTKICYQLRFGHHDTLEFVKSLDTLIDDHKIKKINFNDLPNIRKRPKEDCFISNDNKYIYFKIKEITTELYNGLVYNFECDTHTYLGRNIGYHNCDSYDQDEAHTSTSKGAMYIKKGYLPGHAITNNWVAEIIERPTVADGGARTFYLHTAMACIAYSCQNNIEYSNLRIFDFYENNGFTSLLKLRPILAFAGKIQNTKVSNRYGTDKSLKPHILAILRDILSPDVINNMYFTRQIRALSKFIYDPSGKKYNCDITIATAECEVSYKENQGFAAKSRGEKKEEVRKRYERDSNGYIKITYK